MKVEPKFRGKSVETDEWVYGCGWYHIDYTEEYKKENNMSERANLLTKSGFVECHLDSMGQYTNLNDKHGLEIFEGDLVEHEMEVNGLWEPYEACKVVFDADSGIYCFDWDSPNLLTDYRNLKVIGNSYDNHELIKEVTE